MRIRGKPAGQKTCLALKDRNQELCGQNMTCILTFFNSDISFCESVDETDQAGCYRSAAMNSRTPQICEKIDEIAMKDDCYFDYAGHIEADPNICEEVKDDQLKQQCYQNVAVSLSNHYFR